MSIHSSESTVAGGMPRAGGDALQLQRWRMFFMACEELFASDRGNEWMVGHYLFGNRDEKMEPDGA